MKFLFVVSCAIVQLFAVLVHADPTETFKSGNKIFTANVYKEGKANKTGNFVVSPFSASVVLSLTQSGAKDKTAEEIRTSLHLPNSDQDTRKALVSYLSSLEPPSDAEPFPKELFSLYSANKIYVKENLPLKEDFKAVASDTYKSDVESIDFAQKSQAASTINQWVEKQTQNKIQNLVKSEDLGDETAVILINSLYLRARWFHKFKESQTKKSKFYRNINDVIEVDTMSQKSKFYDYYKSTSLGATFLQVPLNGPDVSFVIVLPNEKDGLAALEDKSEVFGDHDFKRELVNLDLPKFKTESTLDFKEILKKLGVETVFSQKADLSGIAGKKGELSVAKVLQKTFIDVNEEGIEAAAATQVLAVLGSSFTPDPPKDIIVDHPFIYYIKVNGVILFAGRVVDPTQ